MSVINVLVHTHEWGGNAVGFKLDGVFDDNDLPQIAELLGLDYEPERGESLGLVRLDPDEIDTVVLDPNWVGRSEKDIEDTAKIIADERE